MVRLLIKFCSCLCVFWHCLRVLTMPMWIILIKRQWWLFVHFQIRGNARGRLRREMHSKFLGPERAWRTGPSFLAPRVPIGTAWVKWFISQQHFVACACLPAGFAVRPKMLLQLNLVHVSSHYVSFMINVSHHSISFRHKFHFLGELWTSSEPPHSAHCPPGMKTVSSSATI